MDKILSVSIAAYNAENWLERCLDSFCVFEVMDDIEILIVNDGSCDRTKDIAEKYVKQYPQTFRLINKENGGHGSTINTSICIAAGKYYKVVDADDWVESNGLVDLVQRLKTIDADAFLSPYYVVKAENMQKKLMQSVKDQGRAKRVLKIDEISATINLQMHAITFRTAILQDNFTPIDEHCFYVDMEYLAFYFRLVRTVYISNIPVYDYLLGTNEQSVNIVNMVKRREQHLRVCSRIIEYYDCEGNNKIIKEIINGMIVAQYRVLLAIPEVRQSKSEFLSFERALAQKKDIYEKAISSGIHSRRETAYLVFFLRKIHYHGYWIIHMLCRTLFKTGNNTKRVGEK